MGVNVNTVDYHAKQFAYWESVTTLLFSADPKAPATVGAPDKHNIVTRG